MTQASIPGYEFGSREAAASPLSLEELESMKTSLLWSEEDDEALRLAHDVLEDQVSDILDVWYGFVGSHPHLVYYFTRRNDGQADEEYLERVRARFGQWILDTTAARYDQTWLDYAEEIGRRHHRVGKNRTDRVDAVEHIPMRYLITFIWPITATIRPFLATQGAAEDQVDKMHDAWRKAVILQVALWCRPYVRDGDF